MMHYFHFSLKSDICLFQNISKNYCNFYFKYKSANALAKLAISTVSFLKEDDITFDRSISSC